MTSVCIISHNPQGAISAEFCWKCHYILTTANRISWWWQSWHLMGPLVD